MPSMMSGVLREMTSATRSGATSSSAPKQPIASRRLTWLQTANALSAVLPTAFHPPVQVFCEGMSPTCATTGIALSHSVFWISSEAAQ